MNHVRRSIYLSSSHDHRRRRSIPSFPDVFDDLNGTIVNIVLVDIFVLVMDVILFGYWMYR